MQKILTFLTLVILPAVSFAAEDKVATLLDKILSWVGIAGQILMGATFVAFLYGLFLFVFKTDKQSEGKSIMGWGIVALFVMVSVWGLVKIMGGVVGVDENNTSIEMPVIPGQ